MEVEKSSWNLSEEVIAQIASLLRESSSDYKSGDFYSAFINLEEIRTLVYPDLSEEELIQSNEQAYLIKRINHQVARFQAVERESGTTPKELITYKPILQREIENYKRMLITFINKHGYWVQRKTDITTLSGNKHDNQTPLE